MNQCIFRSALWTFFIRKENIFIINSFLHILGGKQEPAINWTVGIGIDVDWESVNFRSIIFPTSYVWVCFQSPGLLGWISSWSFTSETHLLLVVWRQIRKWGKLFCFLSVLARLNNVQKLKLEQEEGLKSLTVEL